MNENQNNGVMPSENDAQSVDNGNQNAVPQPVNQDSNVQNYTYGQQPVQQPVVQPIQEPVAQAPVSQMQPPVQEDNAQPPVQQQPIQYANTQPQQQVQYTNVQAPVGQTAYQYQPAAPKKPMDKKTLMAILIGGGVVALAAIILFFTAVLPGLGKTKIDLKNHYEIEIVGFNEFGKPQVKTIGSPVEELISKKKSSDYINILNYYSFFDSITFEFNIPENVKNGDTVKATAIFDKQKAKELKLNLKNTTLKLKVKGLGDAIKIDAFADAEVKFEGAAPFGRINVSNNNPDEFIRTIYFETENEDVNGTLKNGDKVVVKAVYDEESAFEKGYVLISPTKEFTVEGLDTYLTDSTTVSSEIQTKYLDEFKKNIEKEIDEDWGYVYSKIGEYCYSPQKTGTDKIELISSKLFTKKTDASEYNVNRLVLTYKITLNATGPDSSMAKYYEYGERTGYVAVIYKNIGYKNDGTVYSGYSKDNTELNYSCYAYKTEEDLNKSQIDDYTSSYISTDLFKTAS